MSAEWTADGLRLLQVIWLDLLLSGDNAVVIALASRGLSPPLRKRAATLGAGAAIALRIIFAVVLVQALRMPWLHAAGGALLLWIAVRLTGGAGGKDGEEVAQATSMWAAVRIIAFADAIMSLDNVLAITAAAGGEAWIVLFGLLVSLPLVVFGASLFVRILKKWPWLLLASAAMVGWSAGQLASDDVALRSVAARLVYPSLWAGAGGAAIVLLAGTLRAALARRRS